MMSRLEEIKKVIPSIQKGMPKEIITWGGWKPVVTIFTEDSEYLLEQAKRAEKLQDQIDNKILPEIEKGWTENIRFRQALDEIYNHAMNFSNIEDLDVKNHDLFEFASRVSFIAQKSLEGESE